MTAIASHRISAQRGDVPVRRSPGILVLILLCAGLSAPGWSSCIANGHYSLAEVAAPLTGVPYAYTEDLATTRSAAPVADHFTIHYRPDLGWTRIQSGCVEQGQRNINSSLPFNLLVHGAVQIVADPAPHAAAGTRYEVQTRLGRSADDPEALIASSEIRRLEGFYPYTERFGGALVRVPAGNFVLSMWIRILDGPSTNAVTIGLQWLNGQGAPSTFPAARATNASDETVSARWVRTGPELKLDAPVTLDLALIGTFQITTATALGSLSIGWSLDDVPSGQQFGTIAVPAGDVLPAGRVIFDDKIAVPAGVHRLQMWMRSSAGKVRLRATTASLVSWPHSSAEPEIIPMQSRLRSDRVVVSTASTDEQPDAIPSICGRWTRLLDFELTPITKSVAYSWTFDGYVDIIGADDMDGQVNLAIEVVHPEPDPSNPQELINAATDMGVYDLDLATHHGGFYFHGDASKWGNWNNPSRIRLWARKISGCRGMALDGQFEVGKRWLTVKLLPSYGNHL